MSGGPVVPVARAPVPRSGGWLPPPLRSLAREIDDRLKRIPTRLNEYGFDPFGFQPDSIRNLQLVMATVYRYWFRAEAHGLENVPEGRVLLIGNHAGNTFAWDGAMLATALFLEAEPPRMVRGMGEFFLTQLPWFSVAMHRAGSVVGTPTNCVNLLQQEEAIMVFPEGERGFVKTYRQRYQLQRFGLGFMRLALETDTPIVPVALVGSEEQNPGLLQLPALGRALGMPSFPITVGFPWLGPLGILPLPVKYRFYFGEPMRFEGDPSEDDGAIQARVDEVRGAIEGMFERGLGEREGIFR